MATTSVDTSTRRPLTRRASAFLFRHRGAQLTFTLGPTLTWMVVIYLFSLVVLLISSFWTLNPLTAQVEHTWSLKNYQTILHGSVYWRVTFRTVVLAAAVTVTDVAARLPARVLRGADGEPACPQRAAVRGRDAAVGELPREGLRVEDDACRRRSARRVPRVVRMAPRASAQASTPCGSPCRYIWLPYVILPILAAFERVPARSSRPRATSALGPGGRSARSCCRS